MYKCENCGNQVPRGAKVRRVTVETRPRTYKVKRRVGRARSKRKRGELPVQYEEYTGWEIANELRVCDSCYNELSGVALAARHEQISPEARVS